MKTQEQVDLEAAGMVLVSDCPLKPSLYVNRDTLAQMSDREIEEMSKVLAKRRFTRIVTASSEISQDPSNKKGASNYRGTLF
jgi:hypothetical protein